MNEKVEVRREEKEKDKVDFKKITELLKGVRKEVEKEMLKVIQMSKKLVTEIVERKRCVII